MVGPPAPALEEEHNTDSDKTELSWCPSEVEAESCLSSASVGFYCSAAKLVRMTTQQMKRVFLMIL